MARNHYYRNHHYRNIYVDDDEEDDEDCCCDCDCRAKCMRQTASLKSRAVIFAGICMFILAVISLISHAGSKDRDYLLGGWNSSIAENLIRSPRSKSQHKSAMTLMNNTIYVITPTYTRPNQKSLLTALAQTFYLVENFHWIVIEDSTVLSPWIRNLLDRFNFNFTQIACDRKAFCKTHKCKTASAKGSVPRNCGLLWLKESGIQDGVLYFADDDNFYDMRLFDEIRNTKKLSVFPVGGFIDTGLSSPVVVKGKLVKFIDPWISDRKWPVDMAGFATNLAAWRKHGCPLFIHNIGYLETKFLQRMNASMETLEVVGASEILVWHNTIKKVACSKTSKMWKAAMKDLPPSNLDTLINRVQC